MESSGKSNPRIILSAHRARNKTVVMGADQLEALRADSQTSSPEEQVADLLGVVGAMSEQEGLEQSELEHSPFNAFPDEEAIESHEPRESAAHEDAFEIGADLLSLDDDSHDLGGGSESVVSDSALNHVMESSVESDPLDTLSEQGSFVETAEPLRASPVIDSGTVNLMETGQASEVSVSDTDAATIHMKERADAEIPAVNNGHRKQRAEKLTPPGANGDALVGFLVSFETDPRGMFVELREGRMIVTCESVGAAPCLVIEDSSVSPMHAIMRISSGEPIYILDQLSEFGTRIIHAESGEEESLSGEKGAARHGDIVVFGEKKFHVCLVSIEKGEVR
jgi:hypothetical protein